MRLPTRSRIIAGVGRVVLQASLRASVPALAWACAAVCLGEALGAAVLHLEASAVSTGVAAALEHTDRVTEARLAHSKRESSKDLAKLAPTITWDDVELLHQIGSGAFGSVHAVRYFGMLAAMKVVHKGKSDAATLRSECRLLLELRHPHVLLTIGLVSDGQQRHGILTELMSRSLAQLLVDAHQPLSWRAPLLRIALQTAQAMAYLHGRGVAHGDLKPANILLGRSPLLHVKIADFGEARRIEAGRSPSGSSPKVSGAPTHMPGAAAGARERTLRADVWAFGGILVHMERREPPFNPAPPLPWVMALARGDASVETSWPATIGQLALSCCLSPTAAASEGGGAASKVSPASGAPTFESCVDSLTAASASLGIDSPAPGTGSSFIRIRSRDGSMDGSSDVAATVGAGARGVLDTSWERQYAGVDHTTSRASPPDAAATGGVLDRAATSHASPRAESLHDALARRSVLRAACQPAAGQLAADAAPVPGNASGPAVADLFADRGSFDISPDSLASLASTVRPASQCGALHSSGAATPLGVRFEAPVASEWCGGRAGSREPAPASRPTARGSQSSQDSSAFRRRKVGQWAGVETPQADTGESSAS